MTGVLTSGEPHTVVVPEQVRFSDVNPLTGDIYARSRFSDLPPWVQAVVEDEVGAGSRWDELVDLGEVFSEVGSRRAYSVRGFLASVKARRGLRGPRNACPDCWGTLAVADTDGSVTGRRGGAYLCVCATGVSTPVIPMPRRSVEMTGLARVNPVNGLPLEESLWEELPGEVADMLMDVDGWMPWAWDARVRERRAVWTDQDAVPSARCIGVVQEMWVSA